MEDVLAVGLIVQAIKAGLVVAFVVERRQLWRIQKPPAPDAVDRKEVSKLSVAEAQPDAAACGAERTVVSVDVPKDSARAQARARGDLRDEAGLVTKFDVRSSRGDFHALDGAGWKLRGEHLALLIADRWSIDDEAGLRMVAQGMKESVAIGGNATRAIHNCLAQTSAGIKGRDFHHGSSVNVD